MKQIILLCCLSLFCMDLNAQNECDSRRYIDPLFESDRTHSNVYYGSARPYFSLFDQDLELDIYEPLGDTLSKRPVIVFAFGGAFLIGDKRQPIIPSYAEYFANRGYVVVSIDYRINFNTLDGGSAERAVYRATQDLRAALRFLADEAETYRLDMDNVFTTGTSAGCVAALHNSYMTENERPESTYGTLLESSDLGCADCSGNNNNNNQEVPVKGIINHWGAIGDTTWISPTTHDNVPCLSIHGTEDPTVPYNVGQPFSLPIWPVLMGSGVIHQRLMNLGINNELRPLWGAGHEPELLSDIVYLDTMYLYGEPFLYSLVRPHTSVISGTASPCLNETETYSVTTTTGSSYCWTVAGGTVVSDNGSNISIQWNTMGTHQISVIEENCVLAVGEEQIFDITVLDPVPVLDASAGIIGGNPTMILVSDNSQNVAEYSVDFGDGTSSSEAAGGTILHTYAAAGTYILTFTISNSCSSEMGTQTIEIVVSGVEDLNELSSQIDIQPNPTRDEILILGADIQVNELSIDVYDLMGRVVLTEKYGAVNGIQQRLDLSNLTSGLYMIRLQIDGENVVKKVIKE